MTLVEAYEKGLHDAYKDGLEYALLCLQRDKKCDGLNQLIEYLSAKTVTKEQE